MLNPENFIHTAQDPWRWSAATGPDVEEIITMVIGEYAQDSQGLWPIDPIEASRNLMHSIVNQMYNPKTELVSVARSTKDNKIVAFTWAGRDARMSWSTEEMIVTKMASVVLSLPRRQRVALCFQMFRLWEKWADICEVKMIASTDIRMNWESFMYMHSLAGYHVRGTHAWKRLSMKTIKIDDPIFMPEITQRSTSYNPENYSEAGKEHSVGSKEFRIAD